MTSIFPEPIRRLPEAAVPLEGVKAYLSQSNGHQILFMEFSKNVVLPEHAHESQWGVVLAGRVELVIGGAVRTLEKGDHYFIPNGVRHSAKICAGYADVSFFNQEDRYHRR